MVNTRARNYDNSVKEDVNLYISTLKNKYYLRSIKNNNPRVNYARFFTSDPESYHYHYIRRSPRIMSMNTPQPNYVE
jgi:uncharacterized pyridoxamine 5'-phosphate oxidase family protein